MAQRQIQSIGQDNTHRMRFLRSFTRNLGTAAFVVAVLAGAIWANQARAESVDGLLAGLFQSKPPAAQTKAGKVQADRIVVYKAKRELVLMRDGKVLKKYWVSLGFGPKGHKKQEGDGKTPEGVYTIDKRKPRSQFYRALHINYPNDADKAQAKDRGVSAGGELYIHGLGRSNVSWMGAAHVLTDWTAGCIALTDTEMDELWSLVADGTPIEIKP